MCIYLKLPPAGIIGNSGCPEDKCVTVEFVDKVRTKVSGKDSEGVSRVLVAVGVK